MTKKEFITKAIIFSKYDVEGTRTLARFTFPDGYSVTRHDYNVLYKGRTLRSRMRDALVADVLAIDASGEHKLPSGLTE